MRNFLPNLNIVGAVLMSRTRELSHYCLHNLLLYCDHIVIVLDNPDKETKELTERYREKYKEIEIVISPYQGTTAEEEEKDPLCVKSRFKNLQGQIRELVFARLRELDKDKKVDLLLFPDSDEMFGKCLPDLLERFWKSDYRAVNMKAVDCFRSFDTIHDEGLTGHPRIFKFSLELTGIPHRFGCRYFPLKREDFMGDRFNLIHLSYLTKENIAWKIKYWSRAKEVNPKMLLWRVGKDIRKCTSEEISAIYKRPADCTVEDYLRGGEKRIPCGIENLSKALRESTDMLDEMGIKYFLAFGTCLLLYRDGEFSKYDWDCDLIILGEDLNKFKVETLAKYGFSDYKCKQDIPKFIRDDGVKSNENYIRTISFKKYGVRVDIDPAYISSDESSRIILKGRKRQQFCALHPREWFDGNQTLTYKGKNYPILYPIEDYLESNYKNTWNKSIYGPVSWDERPCMSKYYECK